MEHILENETLRVSVTSSGAQIKSVVHKSDGAEHIWCGDARVWRFQTPVLFPYTGKVKDGRIDIRGKRVEHAPPHGVVRDMEHALVGRGEDSLTLMAQADDTTIQIFPYRFRFYSTFRLAGASLWHTLTVENTDQEPFSFGIGYHPGFAIPFDPQHTIEDYEIRFSEPESPICLETPEGLLSGRYSIMGSALRVLPVTDGLFDGGGYCMTGLRSKTLGLYERGSGRAVVCHIGDFPYCLLWSQSGRPEFVCIEPWHSLPSTAQGGYSWEEKAAAAALSPGQRWHTTLQMDFVR